MCNAMSTLTKTYLLYLFIGLFGLNLFAQEELTQTEIESIQESIDFDINFAQKLIAAAYCF